MNATAFADTLRYVDVNYLGRPRRIACGVITTSDGLVLVDPGPDVCLSTLREKLDGLERVQAVLLTHIHLDHAGATGSIVAAQPEVQVYVHTIGAPHLADPERLLKSARRIYGDRMEELWGAVLAVPEANLHALDGGETIEVDGRTLETAHTPGHAAHHLSYFDVETGTAFVGDVAGMRLPGARYVLPVTPPPGVDLDVWPRSLDRLRAWQPERLFLTHFGPAAKDDVERHLKAMQERLDEMAEAVRKGLSDSDAEDSEQAAAFEQRYLEDLRAHVSEDAQPAYADFGQLPESWHGLARYWRKR